VHRAQTRRATRTARTTVLKDENANANLRSRIVTRSKPPSTSNHTTQPSAPSRLTAPTVSTRTKAITKDALLDDPAAQGKRKRSTLADVTVNKPKARGLAAEKGKAKDATQAVPVPPSKFAGVVIKNKSAATTAIPQSRQVLRSVTAAAPHLAPPSKRTTRSSAAPNHVVTGTKVELKATLHVDAMVIDPPDLHVPPTRVNGHVRKATSLAAAAQRTLAGHANHEERERDETEAEANRVFKKRRTSSEGPEDEKENGKEHVEVGDQVCDIAERELQKHLQNIGREVEADPDGPNWEDLDAEDADDPMMVSEYVTEIFEYLKIVEVRFPLG
jgi:G2/mitotic-specific cyclin 2